jgi:sacsin
VLATKVAQDQPRNRTLLRHLEQTYKWLNENVDSAQLFLRRHTSEAIFLNVDDPKDIHEEWNWKRAGQILLDAEYDTAGGHQCPRTFLKPFKSLLVAAGALATDYGNVDAVYQLQSDEDKLENLCTSFDSMRLNGICTDVSFVCDPPDDKPLCAHRAYLAASTNHFREMFSGTFSEAAKASSEEPIKIDVPGYSRKCVEYILGKGSFITLVS